MIYIEQPPFLPWLGFCEALVACSTVALYDDVAYSERGWQNRNRIKTPNGVAWVTVPVVRNSGQLIRDVRIAEVFRPQQTLKSLRTAYGRSPYAEEVLQVIAPPLVQNTRWLADLNIGLVTQIATALGSRAHLVLTSQLRIQAADGKSEWIARICAHAQEKELWAGSGTRRYLDTGALAQQQIAVAWNEFADRHPHYAQAWPQQGFVPGLSVVDAACALGWAGLAAMLRSGYTAYRTATGGPQ
ncbi:WbqC family protein [Streptomyces sp. NPDC048442]|uniref:WbqC family protein n=1 Tax=Streptomyces sp. NPDC048442 TaxID=3154823 RepID=UPI003414C5CD